MMLIFLNHSQKKIVSKNSEQKTNLKKTLFYCNFGRNLAFCANTAKQRTCQTTKIEKNHFSPS